MYSLHILITKKGNRSSLSKKFYFSLTDHKTIWNDRSFFYYNDPIFYCIKRVVFIFKMRTSIDPYIVTDPDIFINDRIFNIATIANPKQWNAPFFCLGYFSNG